MGLAFRRVLCYLWPAPERHDYMRFQFFFFVGHFSMLGDTGLIDRDGETFAFFMLCRRKFRRLP